MRCACGGEVVATKATAYHGETVFGHEEEILLVEGLCEAHLPEDAMCGLQRDHRPWVVLWGELATPAAFARAFCAMKAEQEREYQEALKWMRALKVVWEAKPTAANEAALTEARQNVRNAREWASWPTFPDM